MTKLNELHVLEKAQEIVILDAIIECFIRADTAAHDATHFEARDQAPYKRKKVQAAPKKRGCKKNEAREQWLMGQAE